ncbi:hypothetical protein KDW_59760 [Dictyobacter vulcani]|uniref:Uncharacterized protein n=1 Tax=Dictyobacter vulcani TaxID=2607529 RepID=A0A5J4KR11_9CHLR|nr:hypothetical protein KDW_59760 [Dictyobacter vulcani]
MKNDEKMLKYISDYVGHELFERTIHSTIFKMKEGNDAIS